MQKQHLIFDYGNLGTNKLLQSLEIYNRELSEQEIKDYHNQFASKYDFIEDFFTYPIGVINPNFGVWHKQSGSYSIVEDSIEKYLKCTSSGMMSVALKARYGTTKLLVKKGSSSNNTDILIGTSYKKGISTGNTGYVFRLASDNHCYFYSFNGITLTSLNTLSLITLNSNLWIEVDIKLFNDNTFKIYVNGIKSLEGTISTIYLDQYITLDLDTNDSIKYLTHQVGIPC